MAVNLKNVPTAVTATSLLNLEPRALMAIVGQVIADQIDACILTVADETDATEISVKTLTESMRGAKPAAMEELDAWLAEFSSAIRSQLQNCKPVAQVKEIKFNDSTLKAVALSLV
jgi:anthranilate phosphoribosyltransferase